MPDIDEQLIDPRRGDAEDDASSTKQRSLLAIAGSLLAEISLPKLLFDWASRFCCRRSCSASRRWRRRPGSPRPRQILELTGIGAAIVAHRCRRDRLDRLAPAVSHRRNQFLVAERAGGPARLRVLARGAPASERSGARGRATAAGLARLQCALSCAGAGILLCASRRWSQCSRGRRRAGSATRQTSPSPQL